MKFLAAVLGCGVLAWSATAFADDIDLSSWTCHQFQSASKDDVGVILAWLDGYYKNEDDPPVIATGQFVANAKKLGDYCSAHPDVGLITATDKLFRKNKCRHCEPTGPARSGRPDDKLREAIRACG